MLLWNSNNRFVTTNIQDYNMIDSQEKSIEKDLNWGECKSN